MSEGGTRLATSAFSAEVASSLAGPRWLVLRRAAAAEAFGAHDLPNESEEEWRYSRIEELDLAGYSPVTSPGPGTAGRGAALEQLLGAIGPRAGLVHSAGGFVRSVELGAQASAVGVRLSATDALPDPPPQLGAVLGPRADAFTLLSDAFCGDVVVCHVPPGARIEHPIVIAHEVAGLPDGSAVFPRTVVSLGEGAEASVVELFMSDDGRHLVVPISEVELADAARLAFTTIQQLGRQAWQVAYQASRIGRDAVLRSFVAALGGDYARHLTQSALTGDNAKSELLAVYLGDGSQVQDLRTFQEHIAPRTRSELVFKGAVADTARSVYTGLIHMHRGAKRADASQTNRNLVLSEGAHAYSVPNLDIEENDVRCSHASAVGPIDVDQLFYLESRGVPPDIAERLVLLGFFDDLLVRAPEPGVAAHLRQVVAKRLADGVLAAGARTGGSPEGASEVRR